MRDPAADAISAQADHVDGPVTVGAGDVSALSAIGVLFVVMLALTWHRWADPVIDHGRELNVPARLLAGEWLYRDIYYYYGPVAPYLGALLYSIFGARMGVLHAAGMASAGAILALIYWLARQLQAVPQAAATTGLVLVLCVLAPTLGNYIQPYAYAALYGTVCSLLALTCSVRHLSAPRGRWLLAAGIGVALALACKPELALVSGIPALTAWAVACGHERRWRWRPLLHLAVPVVVASLAVYGTIVLLVPWDRVFGQTYESHVQPQMRFFIASVTGTLYGADAGWAIAKASGWCLLGCCMSASYALARDAGRTPGWWRWALAAGVMAVSGLLAILGTPATDPRLDIQPLRAAPVVIGGTIGWGVWRMVRGNATGEPVPYRTRALLVISVFAFMTIARMLLNVTIFGPYAIFAVPMSIVVYGFLLTHGWPAMFPDGLRRRVTALGTALMVAGVISLAVRDVLVIRTLRHSPIRTDRGTLLTDQARAAAFRQAIDFVRMYTAPKETVVVFPEGTMINFLAGRPYPLADEIVVPGYLTAAREREILLRLNELNVRVVLLVNRLTPEYVDIGFGVQWAGELKRWIDQRYRPVATFDGSGRSPDGLLFGTPVFFIRAYERRDLADSEQTSSRTSTMVARPR